jgi:thiol-disulfide isomerase/thioredoxin
MRVGKIFLSLVLLGLIFWSQNGLATDLPSVTGDTWFNSKPLSGKDLDNHVVLVFFWTFGCHNCRAVEPYIKQWYQGYAKKGLAVIAIHSPEFDYERKPENVQDYISKNALTYPIVLDNDFVNWKRFSNHYWPTIYLADRKGKVVYRKIGEGSYKETELWIQNLLEETSL